MEIRQHAKTVQDSTVTAIATWAYNRMKATPPLQGTQMTYNDYGEVGNYKQVVAMVLDKGITVRVHFYNNKGDNAPADSAMVVFSQKAY